jgi:Domain of unknown function (DUF5655)
MANRKSSATRAVARKSAPRKRQLKAARPAAHVHGESLYAVHPGVALVQRWISELAVKTGRSFEQWQRHIRAAGPPTEKECRVWLKDEFQLGTNTAWWLAEKAFGKQLGLAEDTPEGYLAMAPVYVEQMYAGPKAALRPIHDELLRLARQLGSDVRICPCQTIVPLYRRHVFAQIKPATHKRIDLGFALAEEPFTARLRNAGGLAKKGGMAQKDRITHCVALTSVADVDLQVKRWLKQAYGHDG